MSLFKEIPLYQAAKRAGPGFRHQAVYKPYVPKTPACLPHAELHLTLSLVVPQQAGRPSRPDAGQGIGL